MRHVETSYKVVLVAEPARPDGTGGKQGPGRCEPAARQHGDWCQYLEGLIRAGRKPQSHDAVPVGTSQNFSAGHAMERHHLIRLSKRALPLPPDIRRLAEPFDPFEENLRICRIGEQAGSFWQ